MLTAEISELFVLGFCLGFGVAFIAVCMAAMWHITRMI